MSVDPATLYDTLYLLASENTEADLFGSSVSLSQEAFRRASLDEIMPTIWFEVPLSGSPRFDLHIAYSNADLHKYSPFASDAMDGYGKLLNWYASEPREGGGLALAYDVGDSRINAPAVHVNVNGTSFFDAKGFFDCVGREDACALYEGFAEKLPEGWHIWYFGVHPGRLGAPVRVDCFVESSMKATYESDLSLLDSHLRDCGFTATSEALRSLVDLVIRSPFTLEFQFDVLYDGLLGPTIGVSAGFSSVSSQLKTLFTDGGPAADLMDQIERFGLADARRKLISKTYFAKLVRADEGTFALYCIPTFVKLRIRNGEPLDAKIYLQAGAR